MDIITNEWLEVGKDSIPIDREMVVRTSKYQKYAARQVVTDIGRSVNLSADQAVIMNLGAMLPNDYLRDLAGSARPTLDGGVCAK